MKNILVTTIIIFLLTISIYSIYHTYKLGSSEEDYSIMCIGGHEYYRTSFFNKGFLAIKLNDNGLPVNCK